MSMFFLVWSFLLSIVCPNAKGSEAEYNVGSILLISILVLINT